MSDPGTPCAVCGNLAEASMHKSWNFDHAFAPPAPVMLRSAVADFVDELIDAGPWRRLFVAVGWKRLNPSTKGTP